MTLANLRTNPKSTGFASAGVTHENPEIASYAVAPDHAPLSTRVGGTARTDGNRTDPPDPRLHFRSAPEPVVVAGPLLRGPQLSFPEFLADQNCRDYCRMVLGGEDTAAGMMLLEFLKGTEFHFFGVRAGKLNEQRSATKLALKEFARRAYRGDPHKRGIPFWIEVAILVWETYDGLMARRARAERITANENTRITSLPAKRAKRAEYMRTHRARKRAERNTPLTKRVTVRTSRGQILEAKVK